MLQQTAQKLFLSTARHPCMLPNSLRMRGFQDVLAQCDSSVTKDQSQLVMIFRQCQMTATSNIDHLQSKIHGPMPSSKDHIQQQQMHCVHCQVHTLVTGNSGTEPLCLPEFSA
jgi:hypothetical protein